ncbi:ribosomal RNA small subunit methyltransferase A [Candidatus Giovannonibacteria bacterium RIFCSPHIGHO2_12_44_12]|uniref:Ribosomal RNA small subunit methyltransferase A n=6 Tax=Candidatus Giovannoniibacteriota TaxID=1752738 RepID=A0A1F5WXV5_9BACT|nr:MAG: ribosomal RNA small subunit methyltransferase A [Candidatus Giovannonibacteria bacterium RIFCSPHIGHO2_02_43_16]OGF80474.1 MAG: ribosomal RNA small subunit methyltransferase A [Candidatus Giovannonibacteria bacterium RIFCSPHIGHO2_12_44_12]OGF85118.1 MAG: ribosomal RNA small subunit methyltransferase A [Candidatus Giovannonibacteria bacterium RIFCSPLOWO2_02_44_8]OGF94721.1 MAG: ribosomal RNA small subunit methyltransferase A [Candidatus Giovannonibacteria bacterium RIFCSPLOWO2_12_43_8]
MRAKKRLGQNFLKNKRILEEIIRVGEVSKKDVILEAGPGHGELTELLARRAKKVIAVEKDRDLIPLLQEKFSKNKNVEICKGDILEFNSNKLPDKNYKLIANIPYYITSRFLRLFLSQTKFRPKLAVLMVQKEVAERILVKDGKESLLSLSVKAYGKPEIIRSVNKKFFSPPPKVDSAIIKISEISDKFFRENRISEKKFFEILRKAFQQKRKMLRHSLKLPKSDFGMSDFGMRRPEELSLEDWAEISLYFIGD